MKCGKYDPKICNKKCPGRDYRLAAVKYPDTRSFHRYPCGSEAPCGRTCERMSNISHVEHERSGCFVYAKAWWHEKKKEK